MKILVFGKNGQLATEIGICSKAYKNLEIIQLDRNQANLEHPEECREMVYLKKPDVIINTAAYTNVEKAEEEEDLANLINGESPKAIAEAAKCLKCPMIHLSTDYVFDDQVKSPKLVSAHTNPLNAYGRSKLLGETAIQESNCDYVILRTSWVFSSHGQNFVKSILSLSKEQNILEVVGDQIGGPTSAKELAKVCLNISCKLLEDSSLKGVYHYSGSPNVSWFSFAEAILGNNDKIQIKEIKTSAYVSKVLRPYNSCLDCSDLEKNFGINRPLWNKDLKEVLEELEG